MSFDVTTLSVVVAGLAAPIGGLLIYLMSRRGQLRALNTTSDASIVASATTLVTSLQSQVTQLTERIARLDGERNADRINFVEQLNRAHDENIRINVMAAQLRTDMDIATRQLAELRTHLPGSDNAHGSAQ